MPNSEEIDIKDKLLLEVERNDLENTKKLLQKGALTTNKKDGFSCLALAVRNNNPKMLALLLKYKAKPSIIAYEGLDRTLIQYAAELQAWDCVIMVASFYKAGLHDYGKYGEVLLLAVEQRKYTAVEALVRAGAPITNKKGSRTCKEIAINLNDVRMLWLLENKSLPDFCLNDRPSSMPPSPKKIAKTSPILQSYKSAGHSPILVTKERRGSIYSFFPNQSPIPEIEPLPMPEWIRDSEWIEKHPKVYNKGS